MKWPPIATWRLVSTFSLGTDLRAATWYTQSSADDTNACTFCGHRIRCRPFKGAWWGNGTEKHKRKSIALLRSDAVKRLLWLCGWRTAGSFSFVFFCFFFKIPQREEGRASLRNVCHHPHCRQVWPRRRSPGTQRITDTIKLTYSMLKKSTLL